MGILGTIGGGLLVAFGGLFLYAGALGLKSAVDYTRLSIEDGRDVGDGDLVGVHGTVTGTEPLASTFTERPCVAHKWAVERFTQNHDRGREWTTKQVDGDVAAFTLETDDGTTVTVEPPDDPSPRAHLVFSETPVLGQLEPGEEPPEQLQALIDEGVVEPNEGSIGAELDDELGSYDQPLGTRRYRERVVQTGDDVYAYGEASVDGGEVTLTRGAVFAVSDTDDEDVGQKRLGQTAVVTLAGLFLLLLGVGVLL